MDKFGLNMAIAEARSKKQEARCNRPELPDRIDFFLIRSTSAI
ncbi:MAG: hypothetical protein WBL95_00210 [Microcoleus sp.]